MFDNAFSQKVTRYILATRPWSLSASVLPALLGHLLAYKEFGFVSTTLCILSTLTVICVHVSGNLVNTYYDFVNGVDTDISDDKTLTGGYLKAEDIFRFAVISYIVAGVTVFVITPIIIDTVDLQAQRAGFLFTLFCLACTLSFVYTGSIGLKYYALGDVVIIIAFGPLIVLYAYRVHNYSLESPWKLFVHSLPLTFITEAILHSNNARDLEEDAKSNIITLPIILGKRASRYLYNILITLPYFYLLFVTYMFSCCWYLIPFLSLPKAFSLYRRFSEWDLKDIVVETAKMHFVFGTLYLFAIWL